MHQSGGVGAAALHQFSRAFGVAAASAVSWVPPPPEIGRSIDGSRKLEMVLPNQPMIQRGCIDSTEAAKEEASL